MTSDDKDQKEIEKIEHMFKQAEKSYSGFSEPEHPLVAASNTNNPPCSEKISTLGQETSTGYSLESLTWISSVLEDLANFAEFRRLWELEACLKDTHRKVEKILQKMGEP